MKRVATLLFIATLSIWSCETTEEGDLEGILDFDELPEAKEEDQAGSRAKSQEARDELEQALSDIYDADEIDLYQMDFARVDQLYQEAIDADPKNTEAQFGAALAHLLGLAANEDARAVQDSLNAYMENDDDQEISIGPSPGGNSETVAKLPLIPAKMAVRALEDPLTVSDIQEAIDQEIVPAIDYALERFAIVEGDPDFSFTLTPEMQGDEEEEPREIDLGEVYLLDAQLRLLKAVLQVATAYNFDFDENGGYGFFEDDSDENVLRQVVRLDQTGSFMTLKSAAKMQGAKTLILEAIAKMEQGLESIRQEIDNQEDDIIRKEDLEDLDDEVDLSEDDDEIPAFFRDIRTADDALQKAREILEGQVEIEADFDGDEDTPKSTVVFDLGRFFDAPIQDLRRLLPYHEWHLDLLDNRNFSDELVLTDAGGNPLNDSPPLVFPDPSFGGILSNITTNQQLLDLFGFEDENLNEMDLVYEMGFVQREGGIIVTNTSSFSVDAVYSTYVGDSYVRDQRVPVPAGQTVDVVRSVFDQPLNDYYRLAILVEEHQVFEIGNDVLGDVYVTVGEEEITIEAVSWDSYEDDPQDPYETWTISMDD